MTEYLYPSVDEQQVFKRTLETLSAREQISLLVGGSRLLSRREKVALFRTAGFSLLKDRFLPIFLHVLLTRVLAGAIWSFLCGVVVVIALLVLALVDHINSGADVPVIFALICFFAGIICFSLFRFCRDLIRLFKRTRPRAELQRIQGILNSLHDEIRLTVLRSLAGSISHNLPGESLFSALLSGSMTLGALVLLIALLVALSFPFPALGHFPWILCIILVTLVLGFVVPRTASQFLKVRGVT